MTLAQVLAVEGEELLARAVRLEAPIPGLPTEDPQPPCDFAPAKEAAAELARSAGEMRKYLGYFDTERARLAQSLRNAAKAYEEVDEHAAADLDTGSASVSAATPAPQARSRKRRHSTTPGSPQWQLITALTATQISRSGH